MRGLLVFAALTMAPGLAHATDHGQDVAITISPLHLIFPMVEVTGEYAVSRNLGIAAIGGYGTVGLENADGSDAGSVTLYEAGAQARYYVVGSFDHGMQIGAEALYIGATGKSGDGQIDGTAEGIGVGPFIGYKKAARFGLTFDAQLGAQYFAARARSSGGSSSAEAKSDGFGILLNLNLGWSF